MTKAGIEYDLTRTPYSIEEEYTGKNKKAIFFFSSESGMERFKEMYKENRTYLMNSLSNRFKMRVILPPLFCDIQLYKKQERRGFRMIIDGREVLWPGKLVLDGKTVIEMNSNE